MTARECTTAGGAKRPLLERERRAEKQWTRFTGSGGQFPMCRLHGHVTADVRGWAATIGERFSKG
jgi:hypothetical protein